MKQIIEEILLEVCGPQALDPDTDLIGSGLMDSLAVIELADGMEDAGYVFQPARLKREYLRSANSIYIAACRQNGIAVE